MSLDYPLTVQTKSGARRWGSFRVWALASAVDEADYVAENFTDYEVVVKDMRDGSICYSTLTGHANFIPAE